MSQRYLKIIFWVTLHDRDKSSGPIYGQIEVLIIWLLWTRYWVNYCTMNMETQGLCWLNHSQKCCLFSRTVLLWTELSWQRLGDLKLTAITIKQHIRSIYLARRLIENMKLRTTTSIILKNLPFLMLHYLIPEAFICLSNI